MMLQIYQFDEEIVTLNTTKTCFKRFTKIWKELKINIKSLSCLKTIFVFVEAPYSLYVTDCIRILKLCFNNFFENMESCSVNIKFEYIAEHYKILFHVLKYVLSTPCTSTEFTKT